MDISLLNWGAVALGTVLAYGLGTLWFSPRMFGATWSAGSHDIRPPDRPPIAAMTVQLAATFLMAFTIGMTETAQAIGTALAVILAIALFVAGMDLFSQKSGRATLIDAGYVLACGALMIAAQAVL